MRASATLALFVLVVGPALGTPRARAQAPAASARLAPLANPASPAAVELAELPPEVGGVHDGLLAEPGDGRGAPFASWASVALFSGGLSDGPTTAFAPSFGLRLGVFEDLDVEAAWGLLQSVSSVRGVHDGGVGPEPYAGSVERVEAGNPTLSLRWAHAWTGVSLGLGVGFAVPVAALAQAPTDGPSAAARAASRLAHEVWLGMHGGLDAWRFLPERASFFVPMRLSFGGAVGGAVEAAFAWAVPVLGASCPGSATCGGEAGAQVAADVWFDAAPGFRVGLRGAVAAWQLGRVVDLRDDARVQPSLEPWVRAHFGPMFLVGRATLDVGGPQGLEGPNGVWALHVGGGAALPGEDDGR